MDIKTKCIVVGDLNIDMLKESYYSRKLQMAMREYGMKQYITVPTRIIETSKIMIDLIFADENINTEVLLTPAFADQAIL